MRVLIVEDERFLAEALQTGLRHAAIAADIALDGDEALQRVLVTDFTSAPRVTLSTLRKALGPPDLIATVTGVGYRLAVPGEGDAGGGATGEAGAGRVPDEAGAGRRLGVSGSQAGAAPAEERERDGR